MSATAEITALSVSVKGQILSSNFESFKIQTLATIEAINVDLKTKEDFTQAKEDVKMLDVSSKSLVEAEEQILKELKDVYKLIEGTRELDKATRDKKKALEDLIKTRSKEIKDGLILEGYGNLKLDNAANREAVEAATFRKSSPESMATAIDEVVTKMNDVYEANLDLIEACSTEHGDSVLYDKSKLYVMTPELLTVELERRVERKKAAENEARLKAEADKAKAEAEEERQRVAEKVAQDKAERESKESLIQNKESTVIAPNDDSSNESLPLRKDEGDIRQPSKSGNHFDPRPADAVAGITAEQEWNQFLEDVPAVFLQFRELRLALKNDANQAKAEKMAKAVNAAFIEMKSTN